MSWNTPLTLLTIIITYTWKCDISFIRPTCGRPLHCTVGFIQIAPALLTLYIYYQRHLLRLVLAHQESLL